MAIARIGLIVLGLLLMYLGKKGVLEALLMIPMGLGMATVNAAIMFFDPLNMATGGSVDPTKMGTLFLDSSLTINDHVMTILQIDWLQPIYTFTFGNGLIACLVFMGIGSLLDVGFVMQRPFLSIVVALFIELGTIFTLPLARYLDIPPKSAISVVGGADGSMVLFTSFT